MKIVHLSVIEKCDILLKGCTAMRIDMYRDTCNSNCNAKMKFSFCEAL